MVSRRAVLRFLVAAPVVGPVVLKATVAAPQRFVITPAVTRWSQNVWAEMPSRKIYWGAFMRADADRYPAAEWLRRHYAKALREP